MNKQEFWKLIDKSREAANGIAEDQLETLRELLANLEPDEIVSFDRIFREYHGRAYSWPLWGAAYLIGGGCSDDGFLDFRGWLISRGENIYEAALSSPDSLADALTEDDEECQVEGFQYLALQVWEEMTGKSMKDFPIHDLDLPDIVGEEWEEDDLVSMFPRITAKLEDM